MGFPQALDKDGDGSLTKSEFCASLKTLVRFRAQPHTSSGCAQHNPFPAILSIMHTVKYDEPCGVDLRARAHNTAQIAVGQDARIHVSEPDFEVLTQGGLLVDSSSDGGITVVEFERIMRAQLTLHVQARVSAVYLNSFRAAKFLCREFGCYQTVVTFKFSTSGNKSNSASIADLTHMVNLTPILINCVFNFQE